MRRMSLSLLIAVLFYGMSAQLFGQIIITEITLDGQIEIENTGSDTTNLDQYWLCNRPQYERIGALSVECGDVNLAPGEQVTVKTSTINLSGTGDEIGIFVNSNFSDPNSIVDYIIWGVREGATREGIAVDAGIWTSGERAVAVTEGVSLQYDGEGSSATDYLLAAPTICGLTVVDSCEVTAGIISAAGLVELSFCPEDSMAMSIDVTVDSAVGTLQSWVITDTAGAIIELPLAPPFDFSTKAAGVCNIWHISYEVGLMGAAIGENVSELSGCYALSNAIQINTLDSAACAAPVCETNGGQILVLDSLTELTICIDDEIVDTIDIALVENSGSNSAWIVSDTSMNILVIGSSNSFNLDSAGIGACLFIHISYEDDVTGLAVDSNVMNIEGCYSISNSILVNRLGGEDCPNVPTCDVTASEISVNELTDISICVDDNITESITVSSSGGVGSQTTWLVTDTAGLILAVSDTNFFDLESAGAGLCQIWEIWHDGTLEGAVVDSNAVNLSGCIAISNAILVSRLAGDDCPEDCPAEGGALTIVGGETEIDVCAGDGFSDAFDVVLEGDSGSNSAWIIADEDGNILAFPLAPPFDFEGAGAGVAHVYNLAYENGLSGASLGGNINSLGGCFSLSNPIIVRRQFVSGGNLSLASGGQEISYCDDGSGFTAFDVILNNAVGTSMRWIITDEEGNVISFPLGSPFDLEGTGPGTNLLYNLSFEEGATELEIGSSINDLSGCFSLSNPISIIRNTVIGGSLTVSGGMDNISLCVGDSISDSFEVSLDGAVGPNSLYLVTDTNQVILQVSDSSTFDFEEAGAGVCLIWHVSYADELSGADVDSSAANLSGCFELSNAVTVYRVTGEDCPEPCLADGGVATITGGDTTIDICADDQISDSFTIELADASGPNNAWMVTDEDGNILGFPDSTIIDLEGAGPGIALVRNISYEDDVLLPEIGGNIDELFGCFSLSAPITVNRLTGDDCEVVCVVQKSTIVTENGATSITICSDDGESDPVTIVSNGGTGSDDTYLITDEDNRILNIAMGNVFDLEASGSGTSLLYHISSVGTLSGVALGANAQGIEGCYALSNSITVTKLIGDECIELCGTDGGDIMYADGTNEREFCSGDVVFTITHTSEADPELDYFYVLTDAQDNIVEVRNSADGGDYDMTTAAQGVSHIWGWSSDGSVEAEIGASISTLEDECSTLSGDFVNVSRITGGVCDEGCHTPRDVRISRAGNGRYSVRWDKVALAIGYEMEIGFEGLPLSFALVPLSKHKVTVNAPGDRVVVVRVRAVCADGERSPYSRDYLISSETKSKIFRGATKRSIDKIAVSEIVVSEQEPLFPNPAGEFINVWYDGQGVDGQMTIFSRDGREAMRSTLPGDTEYHEVNIQNLSRGMYFMMIRSDGEMWMQEKFVKSDRF